MYKVESTKTKILFFAILLFSIISILPDVSFSVSEIEVQESEITADIIPGNPQPYQDVTIKLTSYATDINKAMIIWQNGSSTVLSGYGKTSYSFKALGPDSISIIDIKITPAGSTNSISKRVVVNPSEILLLWESVDGYTPPFYRGKSFVSAEGKIKVVAIPNTNTIKSGKGDIVYTWQSNNNTMLDASGYGKDSFIVKNSLLKDAEVINVSASSINGMYNSKGGITVPIVTPKIIFYKKSPTEGTLYNEAINNETSIGESETTIVAEPYFLSLKGREDGFNYTWEINGDQISTPSKKRELTVKPTSAGGYADVSLLIESMTGLFQSVSGQIKLNL